LTVGPGTRVGHYVIEAPLGAGGMGEVYRAHDPRLGRDVALKLLRTEVANDQTRLERFTREARAVAALNHPHIVTIYSTEEADGVRFMTMELLEGQSLDQLIPAQGLPLARFLELAVPIADALKTAHQKQITHRDLKPANVMVSFDGRVKVLDFGLATAPAEAGALGTSVDRPGSSPADQLTIASPQITTPGMIVGTMPYMSPEQIEGKVLDDRSDLFSLGVMFYEMLTGMRPFTGESSPQLMSSILRDAPRDINEIRGDVPDALSRLLARCLEKRPDERVQTARDVYNELRHLQRSADAGPLRRASSGTATAAVSAESLRIVVKPFVAQGDRDAEALARGLTEDLTHGLARFPYLAVATRASTNPERSGRAGIGARYVVEGSVRMSADRVRIGAQPSTPSRVSISGPIPTTAISPQPTSSRSRMTSSIGWWRRSPTSTACSCSR
jgi:serine/threonine protein kinase